MHHIMNFLREEEGATAIEYGLIAGLVAVAIITVLTTMGTELNTLFGRVNAALTRAGAAS